MTARTAAIDSDKVRLPATVVLTDANGRHFELLAVVGTGDVPRLGFVLQREELADGKQRYSECCGSGWSVAHDYTFPQVRLDCTCPLAHAGRT